jgi:glycosyltransferase involved in cell wall biosynthesis
MSWKEQLSVAIDVRVTPGKSGGVSQAIMSLVSGLGKLDDGPEEYKIIVRTPRQREWLKPFLGSNQQLVDVVEPKKSSARRLIKKILRPFATALLGAVDENMNRWPDVPISDGYYESLGCDVIHFPTQTFTLCALPAIYNPHDIQHRHYPQFFTPDTLAWRETIYPAGCYFSNTVVVGSQWIKDDIVRHYRTDPDKIQVIPENPPTQLYREPSQEDLSRVRDKFDLKQSFAIYPAVTWPHKGHIPLLRAIALLRDSRDLIINLVCTGSLYESHWPKIKKCIDELNLSSQVKFLGFVSDEDMRATLHLSDFLVQPTLFEASSLPIFEAWAEGVPVTCSNRTALPDQVFDAALMFDPGSIESIADAVARMATEEELRRDLRERGSRRLGDFDAERTAKAYRAVYRRAAGHTMSEEDRWLLEWDWMRKPQRVMEALS